MSLSACSTGCPPHRTSTIRSLKIWKYCHVFPGYNGSFQNRAELLDVFGEHPCDLLRVADMRTYPPNPDKYRATYREEDKIIVGPLQGWCVLFVLC
jgi:hypothetical protein